MPPRGGAVPVQPAPPPVAPPSAQPPTLLERLMPIYDAARVEHLVIRGDLATVYDAVREADFADTVRRSAAVRVLFGVRELAERAVASVRGTPPPAPPPDTTFSLAAMPERGEWIRLGEDPPQEIVFGSAGRFWAGETRWEEIDVVAFETFARPGSARIAGAFTLHPYGSDRVLVSYECRTQATDAAARQAFLRYWRPLSPFIGVVLRAQLRVIEAQALRAAG
jgi:hypothetical protein